MQLGKEENLFSQSPLTPVELGKEELFFLQVTSSPNPLKENPFYPSYPPPPPPQQLGKGVKKET